MTWSVTSQGPHRRIVHVTADYPDAVDPHKTPAVRAWMELTDERFDHHVISLNRRCPSLRRLAAILTRRHGSMEVVQVDGDVESAIYQALPKGLLHATMLKRLAESIATRIAKGPRPDLLVGYKLTIEGLVVAEVARILDLPYAVVIQGCTDARIVAARPDLASSFAKVLQGAACVMSVSPWALVEIQRQLGIRIRHSVDLPCAVKLDRPIAPAIGGEAWFSGFHFRNAHVKNFDRLAAAVGRARRTYAEIGLDLAGSGNPAQTRRIAHVARRTGGIRMIGHVPNAAMAMHYNRAIGFAMPSRRESFGMVFVEALMCGCPIVYPKGRAVSGWFDRAPFAIAVDPTDVQAITDGLLQVKLDEPALKSALHAWQQSGAARRFMRDTIAETYADALAGACA